MSTSYDREVSKVGEWKTIGQRELKAAGARKKQRRALGVAGTTAGVAGAMAARNPRAARAALSQVRNVPKRGYQGSGVGSMHRSNPTGAAITGLAAASGASLGVAGSQRGVEAYHQHKINQRRRANAVKKNHDTHVVPASRRRPQAAARMAVRRVRRTDIQRPDNPFLVQKDERRRDGRGATALAAGSSATTFAGFGENVRGWRQHDRGLKQQAAQRGTTPVTVKRRRGTYNIASGSRTPEAQMARGMRTASRGNRMMAAGLIGGAAAIGIESSRQRESQVTKNDQRLNQQKKVQSYISSSGATLGIGALGAAGVAAATRNPAMARRLVRTTGRSADQIRTKANSASSALTTGSAGIGGVGGFNFASIQSKEAKQAERNARRQGVGKSMDTDVEKSLRGMGASLRRAGSEFSSYMTGRGVTRGDRKAAEAARAGFDRSRQVSTTGQYRGRQGPSGGQSNRGVTGVGASSVPRNARQRRAYNQGAYQGRMAGSGTPPPPPPRSPGGYGSVAQGGSAAGGFNRSPSQPFGVRKNMSTSVWGIDHGEPVFKNDARSKDRMSAGLGAAGAVAGTPLPGAVYNAAQARPGRRAAVGARSYARQTGAGVGYGLGGALAGGAAGGVAGAGASALTRGRVNPNSAIRAGTAVGGGVGSGAGLVVGSGRGNRNALRSARQRGDLR